MTTAQSRRIKAEEMPDKPGYRENLNVPRRARRKSSLALYIAECILWRDSEETRPPWRTAY